MDEILNFASKDTKLPIKHSVKRELAGREQVRKFVQTHMQEDKDAQRLQRSEASMKKFGLLPRDFDLGKFLLDLLEDQVAGYYDPKTKTVYLLDWVAPEAQRPVLAHELTHALQDQNFGLDKWLKVRDDDQHDNPDNLDTGDDEEQAARQAVSEGQGMAVMMDYVLEPSGHSLADTPGAGEIFKQNTMDRAGDSPIFASAPLYLREMVIFPYTYGLSFHEDLLTRGGAIWPSPGRSRIRRAIPARSCSRIPISTASTWSRCGCPGSPTCSRKTTSDTIPAPWANSTCTSCSSSTRAPSWRRSSLRPGAAAFTTWAEEGRQAAQARCPDSHERPGAALRFQLGHAGGCRLLRQGLQPVASKKYKSVTPVAEQKGRAWTTEQGLVSIEVAGNRVLVMEGFDAATAAAVRAKVLSRDFRVDATAACAIWPRRCGRPWGFSARAVSRLVYPLAAVILSERARFWRASRRTPAPKGIVK